MANCKSAKKRIKQIAKRTARNVERKSRIKTFIKKFLAALQNNDPVALKEAFSVAQSEIQRGVTKGVLHKNTASRKISRLNKMMKSVITD